MENMEEVREVFTAECSEILQKMETILLELEEVDQPSEEKIHELFRFIHTIKGSAGIFGYEAIVNFTHIVESLLDKIREGLLVFKKELVSLLLDCRDHISDLIEAAANGNPLERMTIKNQEKLTGILEKYLGITPASSKIIDKLEENTVTPSPNSDKSKQEKKSIPHLWHISLRFKEDTIRNGLDPFSTFQYLNRVGEIIRLYTLTNKVPTIENLDPEGCYLGFELLYKCDKDLLFIQDAFEFVQYDCDIYILSPQRKPENWIEFFVYRKEPTLRLVRSLLYTKSLDKKTLKQINIFYKKTKNQGSVQEKLEDLEPITAEALDISHSLESIPKSRENNPKENKSIRIDSSKLDVLINLVGELVVNGANLTQISADRKDSGLIEIVSHLNVLINDIRDTSLNLRMVQIGDTFNRFHRVVRDISQELNKDVQLVITGGETELDKILVEKMNDPLMHLIRNSLDHGIESMEERVSKGKPSKGKLSLHAFHEAGNIVIEVKDDGRGLDKSKILNKAIEKGLISPDKTLSDSEINRLIFKAGFSTAEKVTSISGRGVGLDVVEKNIESLRGSITLYSEENKGSTFQIRLPLTLAIIDGFLFRISNFYYVVPLYQIVECIEYKDETSSENGNDFINLRGNLLPFLRLSNLFQLPENNTITRKNILILQNMGTQVGILVDSLHGEFQTVIKPLGKLFQNLRGISGTTVLGNGEVALILDVGMLFQRASFLQKEGSV
jgi:two-component system, chemotaxis family, sensor kinase CheA